MHINNTAIIYSTFKPTGPGVDSKNNDTMYLMSMYNRLGWDILMSSKGLG